ncbi:hypothetical protein [Nonomuraea gerenzanensis]|uniref:Putative DNA primase/helicase n=1 Tax=Nonomuraea gerenzanensis TaxID=93944 RepID=A0A1M4BKW9_9ACTN|nr:hypothetical protein [Nonomuraea gerenzanensis]UBU10012.1 hypothetical protein LCN96_37425 [Nonomuraea gerenzanensis]SAP16279.1 putative DNA primase/helicase [Nonomuraea gerenzanensis]
MTSEQEPPPAADLDEARRWLATLHGDAPGLINIVATDAWSGRTFGTDAAGLDAATAYIARLDRQRRAGIYVRATTLKEAPAEGRGLADLSLSFPGFWADIDIAGPGHKHELCAPDCRKAHRSHVTLPLPPTPEDGQLILEAAGLPEPTMWIQSGGGWYPWHLLDQPVTITPDNLEDLGTLSARWQIVLEAGAHYLGYHYGRGVGDLARVLRVPGTVNRKAGLARRCTIVEASGVTYSLDELATLLYSIDLPDPEPAAYTVPPARPRATSYRPGTVGPYDALGEVCEWSDLFEPNNCRYVRSERDGAELWKYTGSSPESEYSIRAFPHVCVNHSETTPLPVGAGHHLTHGKTFAWWHHGGNHSAAAKDLILAAAGHPDASPAAAGLRPAILEHIRQRCSVTPWTPKQPPPVDDTPWPDAPADIDYLAPSPPTEPQNGAEAGGDDDWDSIPRHRRGLLPKDFWEARPVFRLIRQAAHARARSGDVVLGGLLARLSSLLPPELRADTGVGSPASMNMFVILLGASGSGKSSAAWIPRRLLPAPSRVDFLDELPLGSGEGIAEAYMGERVVDTDEMFQSGPKKGTPKTAIVRAQVRGNALFYADEGESLTKQLFGRNGTTIGESLRRAWTGGTIGQYNGSKVNTRVVEGGTYSLGLVVGFQPETALPLLEDAAAGTPQRFLWCSSIDPSIPDDVIDEPEPLDLALMRRGFGVEPKVTFAAPLLRQIRLEDRARATGELQLPPLDSHKPLMLVKLSTLLAILDDRLDVTVEDWQLAEQLWATSCELRDALIEYGARHAAEEYEKRTQAHVDRELRAHVAKASTDTAVERVARRIGKRVHEAEGMSRGDAKRAAASRDRERVGAAIDYAEARGWVSVEGDRLVPGDSMPS